MRLLPREEKFFVDFQNQVDVIREAARVLEAGVRAGNSHLADAAERIRKLEEKGDELIHGVLQRLNTTFITPLDPEDIHSLATHLDDVLDGIEEVAHCLVAYRVEPIPPPVIELAVIIRSCTESIAKAIEALSKSKPMLEHCIEINRLEGKADGIYRIAVAELFNGSYEALEVIKLKEIYDALELTTDCSEDVADTLQGVLVKNS